MVSIGIMLEKKEIDLLDEEMYVGMGPNIQHKLNSKIFDWKIERNFEKKV